MQIILHLDESDTLIYRIPTGELPIEDVALKDVPAGKPYLIVDRDELPALSFLGAWIVDFSNPHGFGLGYDEFAKAHGDRLERWKIVLAAYAENEALDQANDEMLEIADQENRQFDALQALKSASCPPSTRPTPCLPRSKFER